tara:strand:- start:466 stop:618 length:153 start_codon:yes stop_codon:yes gene_type:complete
MAKDADSEKTTLNLDKLGGYTQDDAEYWTLLAKIVGNPVVEIDNDDPQTA